MYLFQTEIPKSDYRKYVFASEGRIISRVLKCTTLVLRVVVVLDKRLGTLSGSERQAYTVRSEDTEI